jgi:hypothetical protein
MLRGPAAEGVGAQGLGEAVPSCVPVDYPPRGESPPEVPMQPSETVPFPTRIGRITLGPAQARTTNLLRAFVATGTTNVFIVGSATESSGDFPTSIFFAARNDGPKQGILITAQFPNKVPATFIVTVMQNQAIEFDDPVLYTGD